MFLLLCDLFWASLSFDVLVGILRHTLPNGRVVIAIINLEFRLEPEYRLEPVKTFLAELLDIFVDVSLVVFTAIYPFVQEFRKKFRASFILALVLAEPDIEAVIAAACRRVGSPWTMNNGQSFEIRHYGTVRIGPDHIRFDYFLGGDDNASLCTHCSEFVTWALICS